MNQTSSTNASLVNMANSNTPADFLQALATSKATGCLQVSHNSIDYSIYLSQGKIIYALASAEPFDRLERHLRRLSHQAKQLTNEVRTQVRLNFQADAEKSPKSQREYQAICWLIKQKLLNKSEAQLLVKRLIEEVLELYLLLPTDVQPNFGENANTLPIICSLEVSTLIDTCAKKIEAWQNFQPLIYSLDQRPYYFGNNNTSPQAQKLGKVLKGFSFRQLSAIFNQDEIVLVKKFYPLMKNKTIILREPQPPFDLLPKILKEKPAEIENSFAELKSGNLTQAEDITFGSISAVQQKEWKIVCIDDSQTILNEIERFLANEKVSLVLINDPLKALMKIIRLRPDLILMDVGMPNIDGYKLCSLIRKYSAFKNTPIVMVTGNKGLIDRAKAKIAGATDYMTKPFNQADLLNMVFRYLS